MAIYPTLKEIHFIGIGGIGMSGLAEILLTMGCHVTGSDVKRSPITDRLRRRGGKVFIGHRAENVGKAQAVVVSSAISRSNPEVTQALKAGIPVIARAEMLAELMRLKYGIAVAGSHGKTTTTSLVASVLFAGGFDPTVVIGGRVRSLRSNARLGQGSYLVAEADESDGSFLHLNPTIAVVTNIDREHMDHYRDFEALRKTFEEFVVKIPFYGLAVLCADHRETARLLARFPKRAVSYGIREKADYQAVHVRLNGWESEFDVKYRGEKVGRICLRLPGIHNVLNSLAAVAVGRELGIPFSQIRRALSQFRGIKRRLEVIYPKNYLEISRRSGSAGLRRGGLGVLGQAHTPIIIDDYGHHPTEIEATLSALRKAERSRRLWVLFQPHRYSRTKDLFAEFIRVFKKAAGCWRLHLVLTEIYPAGEEPIQGISGGRLSKAIHGSSFVPNVEEIPNFVLPRLKEGDVILTLGAGDIWKAGKELAKRCSQMK